MKPVNVLNFKFARSHIPDTNTKPICIQNVRRLQREQVYSEIKKLIKFCQKTVSKALYKIKIFIKMNKWNQIGFLLTPLWWCVTGH